MPRFSTHHRARSRAAARTRCSSRCLDPERMVSLFTNPRLGQLERGASPALRRGAPDAFVTRLLGAARSPGRPVLRGYGPPAPPRATAGGAHAGPSDLGRPLSSCRHHRAGSISGGQLPFRGSSTHATGLPARPGPPPRRPVKADARTTQDAFCRIVSPRAMPGDRAPRVALDRLALSRAHPVRPPSTLALRQRATVSLGLAPRRFRAWSTDASDRRLPLDTSSSLLEHPRLVGSRFVATLAGCSTRLRRRFPFGVRFRALSDRPVEPGGPDVSRRPVRFGGPFGLRAGVFAQRAPTDRTSDAPVAFRDAPRWWSTLVFPTDRAAVRRDRFHVAAS